MNREEAIMILENLRPKDVGSRFSAYEIGDALNMAIKALEQEPNYNSVKTELDLISREATLEAFADYVAHGMSMNDYDALEDIVIHMPSISTEKTGRWIKSRDSYGNTHFTCPFCEHDIATKCADTWDNYCSNCGVKLEVEE